MSPSAGEFDDEEFDNDELWNYTPKKESNDNSHAPALDSKQPPWKRSREDEGALQNTTPESPQVPWKRSTRQRPFDRDLANKLASVPTRLSGPLVPHSGIKYGMAIGFSSAAVIVAAWIGGYKLGSGPASSLLQPVSRSSLKSAKLAQLLISAPVSSSPALAVRVGPAQKQQPDGSRGIETSAISAKMKNGVELMTYGEVTKARMMFERAAEAGDGAGAFALAETYDPLVLGGLRSREGITADLRLARNWYKRASDLGAPNAQDRILRLTQIPQQQWQFTLNREDRSQ